MAVVQNFNQQDDQQNKPAGQPVQLSGPSASTPASGPSGFQASSAAPTVQDSPTSSGRFQNLQGYLNANKDFNEGKGLAGRITDDLGNQKEQQSQGIQDAASQWTQQNQSKDINPNDAQQYVQGGIQNATQFTQDPSQVQQFQGYLNAKDNYVAPDQFDANQQYANQVQNYQTNANLTQSEPGRYTLLNNLYSNPNYNVGQQKLDNLLLQANPDQINQLGQVQNYAQDLNNVYSGAAQNTQNLANQYSQDAGQVQTQARDALGNSILDFGNQANSAVNDATRARDTSYNRALAGLSAGYIDQADLNRFGLLPDLTLYNTVNPVNYLHESTNTPTVQNIISKDQQQRINALSTLAGNYLTGDPTQTLNQFAGNKAAGTFDSTPYNLDTAGFRTALQQASGNLQNDLNNFNNGQRVVPDISPHVSPSNNPVDLLQAYQNDISGRQQYQSQTGQDQGPWINDDVANLQALQGILSKYGVDPNTGLGRTLQTVNTPQQGTSTPNFVAEPRGGMVRPS